MADDIGDLNDDEKELVRQHRAQRASQSADEQRDKDAKVEDVKTSFRRLRDIVNGERPTRESNAEYRTRKAGAARGALLKE